MNWSNTMSKVPESQLRWKKENKVQIALDINRNQDPELYDLFIDLQGGRGTLARQLLREAIAARKAKEKAD